MSPGVLDVGQQLAALPHEVEATPQEIARRAHRRRVDVRLRQQPPAEQGGDLLGVDLVVLRFAAVDGLHGQRVAEHEGDVLGGAEIRDPVPREHTLGGHDEIVPVRRDDLEKRRGIRFHVAVHEHLAGGVEDADVHRFDVEIDPAIVAMLSVVESHSVLLLRGMRAGPCARAHSVSRWQGEG